MAETLRAHQPAGEIGENLCCPSFGSSGRILFAPASNVRREDASPRAAKYQPAYPIPVILLARLAVDKTEQKQGIGPALLKDALQRCLRASNEIGARAVLVHAIDEGAKSFYRHLGFKDCVVDDLHLMLLIKRYTRAERLTSREPESRPGPNQKKLSS